jgi:hypothetical protein
MQMNNNTKEKDNQSKNIQAIYGQLEAVFLSRVIEIHLIIDKTYIGQLFSRNVISIKKYLRNRMKVVTRQSFHF